MMKISEIEARIAEIEARDTELMMAARKGFAEMGQAWFDSAEHKANFEASVAVSHEMDEAKRELARARNWAVAVGDGVTIRLWSDREAATVIKRTPKTVWVQRDKATRDPAWKPEWVSGGFSAVCTNDSEQQWIIERDPNGAITRFNWSEKYGRWQSGSDGSIRLGLGRHEYYDYNF